MLKAKTELSRLVQQALQGEEVIITRGGVPVARIVSIQGVPKRPPAGELKGRANWTADAFSTETDLMIEKMFDGE
jgi:prevent-host-death family protein